MNFDLSDEQRLLRDLIERFASDRYDPAKRLNYVRQPNGFSMDGWRLLAEIGVLAFPFGEALGGMGGGNEALITVMEAVGSAVMTEPLLPVTILAGGLIDRAGSAEQKAAWLPSLVEGRGFAALAHIERSARFNLESITTRAIGDGGTVRLDGAKQMVLGGSFANLFIVSAVNDAGVVGLYLVAADAPGLRRRDYRLSDGSLASDLELAQVPAEPMAAGMAPLEATLADARLAICAELLGLMGMMFDATLDYVKTREQFGQPIGQFQTIQHRMADNYARIELSRSHLLRAASTARDTRESAITLSAAKAFISANALALGEDSIQLHGGIGTTEELMVGQAFKRVLLLASLFGDSDWELRRYAGLSRAGAH